MFLMSSVLNRWLVALKICLFKVYGFVLMMMMAGVEAVLVVVVLVVVLVVIAMIMMTREMVVEVIV